MNVLYQELSIPSKPNTPEDLQEDSIDLSLLHLDSLNSSSTTNHPHTSCTTCACHGASSSNKRRSPDPSAPAMNEDHLPRKPKKLFLDPQDTTNTSDPSLCGFSKISLPLHTQQPQSTTSFPVLHRCISDPTHPPVPNVVPQSPPESAKIVGNNAVTTPASKGSASLPPRPPLRRTVSDPSPSKSFSRSSSSNDMDESPSYKALRRMRDCMKELELWWNEVLPEEELREEEDVKGAEDNTPNATQGDSGIDFEEAVSVERTGECLIIHFKCPCSKSYQILLSGTSCYYKLM